MHCIVTEWFDGTVSVTGPYESKEEAIADLPAVVDIVSEQGEILISLNPDGDHALIGDIDHGEDSADVYVQEMKGRL